MPLSPLFLSLLYSEPGPVSLQPPSPYCPSKTHFAKPLPDSPDFGLSQRAQEGTSEDCAFLLFLDDLACEILLSQSSAFFLIICICPYSIYNNICRIRRKSYSSYNFRYRFWISSLNSPRSTKELNADGVGVSGPRIARLMGKNGIKSIMKRKYRVTTNSNHLYPVNENLLLRDFSTTGAGEKWVSDITYIRTGEGWLYLTVVMDLADRKIIGWSMHNSMSAGSTVVDAWKMAVRNRPLQDGLIFHSDRGIQYASHEFRRCFKGLPVLQSMSRKGNCWDNAIAESFFKTLKTEMVYHQKFQTSAQAKLEIFDYIEVWYNRKRRHSALNYLTPVQAERAMLKNKTEAA